MPWTLIAEFDQCIDIVDGQWITLYSEAEANRMIRDAHAQGTRDAIGAVQRIIKGNVITEWFEINGAKMTPEIQRSLDGIFADITTTIRKASEIDPKTIIQRLETQE